jgi:CheY-like chemotaxis protein
MPAVLVVDDLADMRKMIRTMLESDGHTVTEARNGRDALDVLRDGHFDIVVTDILMPESDGIELIRAIASRANMGIIAISGGGSYMPATISLAMAEAMGAGMTLFKPFRKQELLDAVNGLAAELGRRRAASRA